MPSASVVAFRHGLLLDWLNPWLWWISRDDQVYTRLMYMVTMLRHVGYMRSWYVRSTYLVSGLSVSGRISFRVRNIGVRIAAVPQGSGDWIAILLLVKVVK